MKKQNNTQRIIKIALLGLGLLIAIPFCMGMYSGFTSHTGTTGAISKTLKEHCDCKTIELDISAYGAQYSRKDGVTGEKVAYTLEGCKLKNNPCDEAARLNTILIEKVERYTELDVVSFHFIDENVQEDITIKNGIIQNQKL